MEIQDYSFFSLQSRDSLLFLDPSARSHSSYEAPTAQFELFDRDIDNWWFIRTPSHSLMSVKLKKGNPVAFVQEESLGDEDDIFFRVEKNDDGTVSIRNRATNNYLSLTDECLAATASEINEDSKFRLFPAKDFEERRNCSCDPEKKKNIQDHQKAARAGVIAGSAIVGAAVLVVAAPLALGAIGFTSAGITSGSIAAGMMSAEAIASGGGVVAGGVVATLQSMGTGLGLVSGGLCAASGATVGAAVGAGGTTPPGTSFSECSLCRGVVPGESVDDLKM
mmetsp:Transcript_4444/g.6687  ORF Transcript_4444/g.6687 Transcript_4444/m.6687 type:complete len:279 (-) Transcript_4444:35-871(-)